MKDKIIDLILYFVYGFGLMLLVGALLTVFVGISIAIYSLVGESVTATLILVLMIVVCALIVGRYMIGSRSYENP